MIKTIPMMPLPFSFVKGMLRIFYPVSSRFASAFPSIGKNLELLDSEIGKKDYISGAIFTFVIYFILISLILLGVARQVAPEVLRSMETQMMVVLLAFLISFAILIYILILPYWLLTKKIRAVEKDLLFVTRHLMVQTAAGVPLFDAMVSVSERYNDENLDYGEASREFEKIVLMVRTGKDFTEALEESAANNASLYYRKVVWQLANAHRAGADIGDVLKNLVEYLSAEQRIMIQDYGSQLNPLALFYMIICVIGPTMGLIFLMVVSTFVELNISELTFIVILLVLVVIQITFMGLIKSRRPRVAI